jgi:hypothetical protein
MRGPFRQREPIQVRLVRLIPPSSDDPAAASTTYTTYTTSTTYITSTVAKK